MKKGNYALVGILLIVLIIGTVVIVNYMIPKSKEPLIGGCAGVALEHQQECCDRWAEENDIVHVLCVGQWVMEGGVCSWKCQEF